MAGSEVVAIASGLGLLAHASHLRLRLSHPRFHFFMGLMLLHGHALCLAEGNFGGVEGHMELHCDLPH